MKTNLCIAIPTINRKDLLMEALCYYAKEIPNVTKLIVDNGKQGIEILDESTWVWESKENLGVAGSWNFLMTKALMQKFTHVLMLNDDVILQKSEEELYKIVERYPESFQVCKPINNWSSFILPLSVYGQVGFFDERFKKCFFEDNDYHYRLQLRNIHINYTEDLNPQVYRNSQTIEKDPLLGGYIENREYYLKKWGGLPGSELFKNPFS